MTSKASHPVPNFSPIVYDSVHVFFFLRAVIHAMHRAVQKPSARVLCTCKTEPPSHEVD